MSPDQFEILLDNFKEVKQDLKLHIVDSRDRLMKIETRMDSFDDLSPRLRQLESFRWKLLGGVTVISGACAYIFRHIGL